jgi:hypothetical protein
MAFASTRVRREPCASAIEMQGPETLETVRRDERDFAPPSGNVMGNAAFRSSRSVGLPPVTGTDQTSHFVVWVELRGMWKITLRPSGPKLAQMNHQPASVNSRGGTCLRLP